MLCVGTAPLQALDDHAEHIFPSSHTPRGKSRVQGSCLVNEGGTFTTTFSLVPMLRVEIKGTRLLPCE